MYNIIRAISHRGVYLGLLGVFLFNGCIESRHTLRIAVDRMPEQLDPILSLEPMGRRVAAHLYGIWRVGYVGTVKIVGNCGRLALIVGQYLHF